MSRIIGGWDISLEAGIDEAAALYDDPAGGYDQGQVYDADGQPSWLPLDCELTGFGCDHGAVPGQSPGVAAEAGQLSADFYDPDRLLDPTGPRGRLVRPGVPVRVMARRPGGGVSNMLTPEQATASSVDGWVSDIPPVTLMVGGAAEGLSCIAVTNPNPGMNNIYLAGWGSWDLVADPGTTYTVTAAVRSDMPCTAVVSSMYEPGSLPVALVPGVWTTLTYTFTPEEPSLRPVVVSYDSPAGNTLRFDKFGVWVGVGGEWALPGDTEERVVWSGTADGWPHDLLTSEGGLQATDLVAALAPVPVVGLVRPAERTPDRLAALLDIHPEPPPFQPTGVGRMLAPATLDGDLWPCMRAVVDTDQSWLWVGPDGVVRWQGRGFNPPETVLVDCPGPEHYDGVFTGLDTDADDTQLANLLTVRRVQPDPQPDPMVIGDAGSIRVHGPESLDNTALQLPTDAEVYQWANDVLTLRAHPIHRPTEMELTIDPRLPWANRTMDALMGLQVTSLVRIRLTTRGPVQEWQAVVASISHDVTPHSWVARIGLGQVQEAGIGGYDADLYDTATYDTPAAMAVTERTEGLVYA